jgi:thiamine biosynthesis protein ThiI
VSSQTLANLAVVEEAASLPVLRPLLGFDKVEILEQARQIGTAEISVLRDQDCCQLFLPRRVATHTTVGRLADVEARAGMDSLVDNVLSHIQEFDLDSCEATAGALAAQDARTVKDQHPQQ